MTKKLLLWDFRGPDAEPTAEHYRVHLDQYVERNQLSDVSTTIEVITPMYAVASLKVGGEAAVQIEKDLRPHRVEPI